ncbi:MAG TPA: alpha-amylase family glycosyl hydrolase, partial [Ktedonobacteraceae bacterium]|nr:alpha-amylase family glycosyl hydrolase [Ktedonobacteraceae bacterium]
TNVAANTADFKPDVIYQVMLDRFFDGNPSNNNPTGDTGLYDSTKSNWKLYWGGDLAGLAQKIPYIAGMGVTALWISPPVDNTHQPVYSAGSSSPEAGYHGYWARDFYQIDPHLGTWSDFDNLVTTAHNNGIKLIVDFAPNHSNPNDTGEYGSLYKNGAFQAAYNNDPNGWFHHNPGISDYNNLYQDEYYSLSDLADLAQENPSVDSYLKGAMVQFLNHHVDGVRVDAVKHMPGPTGGWDRTLSDTVEAQGPHYMMGEWYLSSINDPTYNSAVEFANHSGINLLNFPLNTALRDVYASGNNASELNDVISKEEGDFSWLNDQADFIDNHDMSRFLTLNNNYDRLHEALAATLTTPGIPIIYYGTEQYLHNDTNGGGDPYNRPQMTNFGTTTLAYNEIKTLAGLRHSNPALAYGTYQQRWINNDVFVFERQFYNNVVLVAINKGSSSYTINNLNTNLPDGSYNDYLGSLLHGGTTLNVSNHAASSFSLGANQVSVWQYTAGENTTPIVGSVGPNLSKPGDQVIIDGQGFGNNAGSVQFGTTRATIDSWSAHSITVTVPGVTGGLYNVQVCSASCSNGYSTRVSSAAQVAVTFTVNNAPSTNYGDNVYLSGQGDELGNWGTTPTTAIGPMNDPNYPNWFIMASVPACQALQFKFIIIRANGSVQWENGSNHSYTTPCSSTGYTNVNWQN